MKDLWLFFGQTAYSGGCYSDETEILGDTVLPPDPVEVAGVVNCRALRRRSELLGFTVLLLGMAILVDPAAIKPLLLLPYGRKRGREGEPKLVFSNRKWGSHFKAFSEGPPPTVLMRKCRSDDILFCSRYFAIAKNDDVARAIFNGKRLSKHWKTPPPVNLLDTARLLRLMESTFTTHHGRMYVVSGDFRHWFHQLEVNDALKRHFGLAIPSGTRIETFLWRCLPMGWSLSPWIAQSCAWGVLTGRNPQQKSLFNEEGLRGDNLPYYLKTVEGGMLTVYYDNYLFVSPSLYEFEEFQKRLERSCRDLGVVIKPGSEVKLSPQMLEDTGFDYLGITFRTRGGRLEWRPTKLDLWKKIYAEVPRPSTTRENARWLGRMLFALQQNMIPLCSHRDGRILLKAMSETGKVAAQGGWDSPLLLSNLHELHDVWMRILQLDEFPYKARQAEDPTPKSPLTFVVASDSSSAGYGYQFYRLNASPSKIEKCEGRRSSLDKKWGPIQREWHIYLKEMRIAVDAVKAFVSLHPNDPFYLVIDNSAVAWGFKHGYTNHEAGMQMLSEIAHLLPKLEVIQVVTGDNPSDCHSRGDWRDRIERMLQYVWKGPYRTRELA